MNDHFKKVCTLFLRYISAIVLFLIRKVSLGSLPPPIPTAAVLIVNNGKILGIKRADGRGFSLPGGIIRWDEDPMKAAKREGEEETGLKIKLTKLFGVYPFFEKNIGINSLNLVYLAKITGGSLKHSFEGQPGWFDKREFYKVKSWTRKTITDFSAYSEKNHERARV